MATGKQMVKVFTPLKMPNAFTPNGDGHNDVFRAPASLQIEIITLSVFDRWGTRIFSTSSNDHGWDGTVNGQLQPPGTYVWKMEYKDLLTGKPTYAGGSLMLIR